MSTKSNKIKKGSEPEIDLSSLVMVTDNLCCKREHLSFLDIFSDESLNIDVGIEDNVRIHVYIKNGRTPVVLYPKKYTYYHNDIVEFSKKPNVNKVSYVINGVSIASYVNGK